MVVLRRHFALSTTYDPLQQTIENNGGKREGAYAVRCAYQDVDISSGVGGGERGGEKGRGGRMLKPAAFKSSASSSSSSYHPPPPSGLSSNCRQRERRLSIGRSRGDHSGRLSTLPFLLSFFPVCRILDVRFPNILSCFFWVGWGLRLQSGMTIDEKEKFSPASITILFNAAASPPPPS